MTIIGNMKEEPTLQPTANRPDAYVAPEANIIGKPQKDGAMTQLAQALSGIEPKLNRFFAQEKEQLTQDEIAQGVQEFHQNRQDWQTYLQAHPEATGLSPHFQRGYRQAWLQNQSVGMEQALEDQYKKNPQVVLPGSDTPVSLHDTDDPRALQLWINQASSEYLQKNVGKTDPLDFAQHLAPAVRAITARLSNQQVELRKAAYVEGMKVEGAKQIGTILDSHYDNLVDPDETVRQAGHAAAGEAVTGLMNEWIKNGMSPKDANELARKMILAQAEEHLDPRMLETLRYVKAGTGFLGDTVESKAQMNAARERIEAQRFTKDSHEWAREEHEIKDYTRKALPGIMDQYQRAGWSYAALSRTPEFQALKAKNPEVAKELMSMGNAGLQNTYDSALNSPAVAQARADVLLGRKSPEDILADRRLHPRIRADLIREWGFKDQHDQQAGTRIDQGFAQDIHGAIVKGDGFGGVTQESMLRGAQAVNWFQDKMTAWEEDFRRKHGGRLPSEAERRLQGTEFQKETIQRFAAPGAVEGFQTPQEIKSLGDSWQSKRMFGDPQQFQLAYQQYVKTGGKDGDLVAAANKIGVPVNDFVAAQATLYGGRPLTPGAPGQPAATGQQVVSPTAQAPKPSAVEQVHPEYAKPGQPTVAQVNPLSPLGDAIATGWGAFLKASRAGTNLDPAHFDNITLDQALKDYQAMTPGERKLIPPALRQQIETVLGPHNTKKD